MTCRAGGADPAGDGPAQDRGQRADPTRDERLEHAASLPLDPRPHRIAAGSRTTCWIRSLFHV
jgi:hypothetical protein